MYPPRLRVRHLATMCCLGAVASGAEPEAKCWTGDSLIATHERGSKAIMVFDKLDKLVADLKNLSSIILQHTLSIECSSFFIIRRITLHEDCGK